MFIIYKNIAVIYNNKSLIYINNDILNKILYLIV